MMAQVSINEQDVENATGGFNQEEVVYAEQEAKKNDASQLCDDDRSNSAASAAGFCYHSDPTIILTVAILCLGVATATSLLSFGIISARQQQQADFIVSSNDVLSKLQTAFEDYVNAAALVHNRCRHGDFTRADFTELYDYLVASNLDFKAVQFDPNITHADREAAEEEAREYYALNYPHVDYQGFRGFNTLNSTTLEPRTNQSFYFPIHYQEPIVGNEAAIDLDYWSSESRIRAVQALFDHEEPSLTDRLSLVKEAGTVSRCGEHNGPSFGVVLMHPGVQVANPTDQWPKDFSSIVLCIPDLLRRSTLALSRSTILYIHDRSHPSGDAVYMGGARVDVHGDSNLISYLDELDLEDVDSSANGADTRYFSQSNVPAANRVWTVSIKAVEGTYEPSIVFVVLGGVIFFVSSVCLAAWVYTNSKRLAKFRKIRAQAESEKAALILQSARNTANAERELNDFISHEVRNPVAAAMAACSFVKAGLVNSNVEQEVHDDVQIIDYSLKFVNDLLRNMLDMHRASNKQMVVTMAPLDVLHDVLEPVSGMLHQRSGHKIKLEVECPPDLFVVGDALRLKQVMINLGRNSTKFIDEGFIRFKAVVLDGNVVLYVDDSGSGIPKEKQERLFAKFQASLDLLNQGTGIGLYLCKLLVELMGGEISLDPDYNSGLPGHPGTRFVINLKTPPIDPPGSTEVAELEADGGNQTHEINKTQLSEQQVLPETFSVLFCDDDNILRRLFARSLQKVLPGWTIREASNGETAIRLVESKEHHFDLIFMDMYMASVEKQLLGTETVVALRERGVECKIVGLSANDKETEFLAAGADAFVFKPFPTEKKALTKELCRVLYSDKRSEESAR